MAERHETFQVQCVANTPKTAPVEQATTINPAVVDRVTVRIPKGHANTTGIALAFAHQAVIPNTVGAWIYGDGETLSYDVAGFGNSGAWSAIMFNTDNRAHFWQVTFYLTEIYVSRRRTGRVVIPASEIQAAGYRNG